MKEIKKILIIGSDSSVKGGITSVINSFLENNWNNIEVKLLPTYIEGNVIKKVIFYIKAICTYIFKVINKEFDLVHIHMSYKGSFIRKFLIVKISNLFNKKVIMHLHGSEFEVFYKNSNKLIRKCITNIFEKSECTVVLGEKWREVISNIAPKANIKVFNNAVRIPAEKVNNDGEVINILFLGVLIKRKGIYELIDAIRILKDKEFFNTYNVRFLIGGTGIEEENIKNKIYQLGIAKHIDMLGWVDKQLKEEVLLKSQILVLPSYNEGLPMAILEAMSYGIPVIASRVGSIDEVVNSSNGYIIDNITPNEIVKGIEVLLKDKNEWNNYSIAAKNDIYKNYNLDKYFCKFETLYSEIILKGE